MLFQKTIRKTVEVEGIGIHSGHPCVLRFRPAPANTGVYFIRKDLKGEPSLKVSAINVQAVSYQTVLGGEHFQVATIEHCLSALSALRIDNILWNASCNTLCEKLTKLTKLNIHCCDDFV